MNPAVIDEMGFRMGEVYGSVTDAILVNLAKHFPYIRDDRRAFSAWQYQVEKLAEIGQIRQETIQILQTMLGGAGAGLQTALETAIMDALQDAEKPLQEAAKRGFLNPPDKSLPELAPNEMQAFRGYYRQSADKLNLVNTVMLESTEQAYTATVADIVNRMSTTQGILNEAAGGVIAGVTTLNTAMRDGVQKMISNGITGFIDHAGRRWSPEAYVTMDTRTTMARTARAAIWERQEQYGNDLYQVSYHDGARPLCYPWQGKVISRSDTPRDVTDDEGNTVHVYAQSETSHGEAAGLFGVNCKHYPIPFVPGFSRIRAPRQNEQENAKEYEQSQQQRALERKLRNEKRDLAVLKAQGATDDEIKAQRERVRAASAKLDDFCDKTGRARRRSREYTPTNPTFPDKDTYDPGTFKKTQRDKMREFFRNGGDDPPPRQMPIHISPPPAPPVAQVPINAASNFIPAKTLAEAEEFAKTYIDTTQFGSVGISFQGVSVDIANAVNKQLSEFVETYHTGKIGGICAPAGNTKLGKLISGATAAYSPVRKSFLLNRKSLKDFKTVAAALAEEKRVVTDVLAHPEKYNIKKMGYTVRKTIENAVTSGRGTVPDTLEDVINHELGHMLEKPLRELQSYETLLENWHKYDSKISGYATTSFSEYIAESFSSWNKGEGLIDPELEKAFIALRGE